ncbi:MAG: hypothetical protein A2148_08915 [Chloroflexi bacterium RBG_16_68_14]|nr:MAG: hypothetical protein A2148_08915 [Chloroflexi bacterium RBG_16_68_14]
MAAASTGWTVVFRGCEQAQQDCDSARFQVTPPQGKSITIEVRTTAQIEQILARELGKQALDAREREAILSPAGRRLIEERLEEKGQVEPLLFLDSRLFRASGAERRLLEQCGLLRRSLS